MLFHVSDGTPSINLQATLSAHSASSGRDTDSEVVCKKCSLPIFKNHLSGKWETDDEWTTICSPDGIMKEGQIHLPPNETEAKKPEATQPYAGLTAYYLRGGA